VPCALLLGELPEVHAVEALRDQERQSGASGVVSSPIPIRLASKSADKLVPEETHSVIVIDE